MSRKGVSNSGGFVQPTNFTEAEARLLWENAMWERRLGPPVWELGPKILRGSADALKMVHPTSYQPPI
jgi:hypothetical protein